MIAGGAAVFTGVLLLGPILVPALIRVAGRVSGRVLGPPGRLAAANAVRNPRRTATTTASLLVGVTLTTAVLTGLASARGAVADDMDVVAPGGRDPHLDRRPAAGDTCCPTCAPYPASRTPSSSTE